MKRSDTYTLGRAGNLLVLRAAVAGRGGKTVVLRLLVDTGASCTMIPIEAAERVGCDTHHPLRTLRIVAANGVIVAPVVKLARFSCLGVALTGFQVVAHTLPSGTYVDGLLGMDFLSCVGAVLDIRRATMQVGG